MTTAIMRNSDGEGGEGLREARRTLAAQRACPRGDVEDGLEVTAAVTHGGDN